MSNKTFTLSDTLYRYLLENSVREPEILRNLREERSEERRVGKECCWWC